MDEISGEILPQRSEQVISESPEQSPLDRFEGVLSSRDYTELMRKHIGVSFDFDYPLIELTDRNREIVEELKLRNSRRGGKPLLGGFYNRELKACFTATNSSGHEVIHELLHAYIDQRNSHISEAVGPVMDTITAMLVNRDSFDLDRLNADIERMISYDVFSEGICEWGALETIRHQPGNKRLPQKCYPNAFGIASNSGIDVLKHAKDRIAQICNGMKKLFRDVHDNKWPKNSGETFWMILGQFYDFGGGLDSGNRYQMGFDFLHSVMQEMLPRRLFGSNADDIERALNLLIDNPPQKLDDILNPSDYVKKIRKRE